MDTSGREVEDIAGFYGMVCQDLRDGAVLHTFLIFVGGDRLVETGIEVGSFIRLDDIPHLGFTPLTMLAQGHLVVGMHLNAQVVFCINELDKQRELALISLVHGFSEDCFGVFGHDRYQVATCVGAVADDAGTARHHAHFPALTDGLGGGR